MTNERTLVLIKHDGIARGLIGKIITRFEETGLKIIALKMVWADENLASKHYPLEESWALNVFQKTKTTHEKNGKKFPYQDHIEFGSLIQKWNAIFLREGPVLAMVIEGPHAIEIVRKMIGATEPRQATPGTIRGDFAMIESYETANAKARVLRNLVHASDCLEAAKREISLWFNEKELHHYSKELDKHL
jgi:nucleoside-diphosphate kinase